MPKSTHFKNMKFLSIRIYETYMNPNKWADTYLYCKYSSTTDPNLLPLFPLTGPGKTSYQENGR